jgi:hypothetical protein
MTTLAYPPLRQLSVGEVLDLSFRIYRITLVKCLLFAACGVLVGQLANIYMLARGQPPGQAGWAALLAQLRDPAIVGLYLLGALLTMVFYAAVLLRQHGMISERAVGGEVGAALRRLPALIGLGVLVLLGFLACFVPALITGGALRAVLVLAAVIALCYGAVAVSCAQTVLLVDGAGPVDSLSRSLRLTAGSFWRLSLIYTVALVILFALYAVSAALAGFLAAVLGRGDVALVTAFGGVLGIALGAVATPFYGALALAVLGDLKVRKEGADLEQRISASA